MFQLNIFMKMITKNENRIAVLIILLYSALTRFLTSTYSLMFNKDAIGGDGACYIAIGREILKGKVLYKDIFDHKMPYVYFINGLASFVNYNIGLFLMEVTILFVTLLFIYKILVLVFDNEIFKNGVMPSKKLRFTIILVGIIIMGVVLSNYTIVGGYYNTEPYVVALVMPSIYIMCKYYYGKISIIDIPKRMFIIGVFAGFVFMINLKGIILFVPLVLPLLYDFIKQKCWIGVLKTFCLGLLGVAVAIIPYVVYMIVTDSVRDMIFAVWDTNLAYAHDDMIYIPNLSELSNSISSKTGFVALMLDLVTKCTKIMVSIGLSIVLLFILNYNRHYKIALCLQILLTCMTIFVVGRPHTYYLYSLLPYLIVIYVFVVKVILNYHFVFYTKLKFRLLCNIVIILLLLFFVTANFYYNYQRTNKDAVSHQYNAERLRNVVREYKPDFSNLNVFALGLHPEVYLWLDADIKYKYFIRPFITYNTYRVAIDEQVKYIISHEPDIFCIQNFDLVTEGQRKQILYALHLYYDQIGETDRFYVFGKKRQ